MYPENMRNKSRIAYLRVTTVYFLRNGPWPDILVQKFHLDCSGVPRSHIGMNRESNDDKSYGRGNVMSLEHYITSLLVTFRYARIWPAESFTQYETFLSITATIVLLTGNFLVLLSELAALTMNITMQMFADIIGVICMHAVGLIKWCYCIRRNGEIINIMMKLEKCHVLCQRIDNSEEGCRIYKNEMENARRYSRFFLYWWICLCMYGAFHWCVNPVLMYILISDQTDSINRTFTKRNLPYIAWYPVNIDDMNNYIYMYLVQIISGFSSAFGISVYDAFYVTMLMIICAQFRYINAILTRTDFDNASSETRTFTLERKLKNSMDCHIEIIKFLELLQTFSGPAMFMQCFETLILICLVSFEIAVIQIEIDRQSILKLWTLLEYFLAASIQLYFFCFYATRIEYLGTRIAHSVYSCGWEFMVVEKECQPNFSERNGLKYYDIKRLVQIIMLRAQKPIILTGGPFYILSLETFRVIISMAMSNSVMLRTISETDS